MKEKLTTIIIDLKLTNLLMNDELEKKIVVNNKYGNSQILLINTIGKKDFNDKRGEETAIFS